MNTTNKLSANVQKHLNETHTIHGAELHKYLEKSPTVDAAMHSIALRQRGRGFINVTRLKLDLRKEGFQIVDRELEEFLAALEKDGDGVMVRSRRYGVPARFLFKYDMRKIAAAVISGKDVAAAELPKEQQREHDGPRKRKTLDTNAEPTATSVSNETKEIMPTVLKINGRTFIDISEDEYNELKRMKEIIRKLVK